MLCVAVAMLRLDWEEQEYIEYNGTYYYKLETDMDENGMEKFVDGNRRECHREEVGHHVAHLLRVKLHAYRILHPRVGHENP